MRSGTRLSVAALEMLAGMEGMPLLSDWLENRRVKCTKLNKVCEEAGRMILIVGWRARKTKSKQSLKARGVGGSR